MTKIVILAVEVEDNYVQDALAIFEEYEEYLNDETGVKKTTIFIEAKGSEAKEK